MSGIATVWGINYSLTDADAQAFLTASGISDSTISSAINQLVKDLKTASIWTKMRALYPFVGGTASTHKWNLKDPVDADASFRATFHGTLTHDANGVQPDGSSGYINTHLAGSDLTNNDTHFSFYSRTDGLSGATFEFGAASAGDATYVQYIARTSVLGGSQVLSDAYNQRVNGAVTTSLGLFTQSVRSAGDHKTYQNSTQIATGITDSNITNITVPITFCARNRNGSIGDFSAKQMALISIGSGLSGADVTALASAVQTFETALSRNV